MNTIQERLTKFLESESLSKSQFADSINMARAGITHIMSGRNMPSYEFIVNVMEVYPFLNVEWLLTGKGTMYKGDHVPDDNDSGLFFTPPVSKAAEEVQTPQPSKNTSEIQDIHFSTDSQEKNPVQSEHPSSIPLETSVNHRISRLLVCFDDGTYQEFS